MMRKAISPLLLVLLLAGCTMIPKLDQPAMPVASDWAERPPMEDGGRTIDQIGWRDFFQSEPLQTILQTTLENNRDLKVALLNVEAARALYRIEKADQWVEVDATASATRARNSEAENTSSYEAVTYNYYTANLVDASFELDLFGLLRSQSESALQTFLATGAARDAVQVSLIAETANAYLQWLADRKNLALAEDTLTSQEKTLELIQKRYENGLGTRLDLSRIRIAVETARANSILYGRQVKLDKNALKLLMGVADESLLEQNASLDSVRLLERLPVGLPSEVLFRRPDIRGAEYELKSANADIGAARAMFFPQISLTGSFGFASYDIDKLFSSKGFGSWSFTPAVSIPIFNRGGNEANLKYAQVQRDIAVANYEKSIQSAFREVADSLDAYKTLDEEWAAVRRLVDESQVSYDLSYARYDAGIDSFLSVLDAQRTLFTAQLQRIEIEKKRLANLVTLYKVLGGGVEVPANQGDWENAKQQ